VRVHDVAVDVDVDAGAQSPVAGKYEPPDDWVTEYPVIAPMPV
jgi:hypothetical protein